MVPTVQECKRGRGGLFSLVPLAVPHLNRFFLRCMQACGHESSALFLEFSRSDVRVDEESYAVADVFRNREPFVTYMQGS